MTIRTKLTLISLLPIATVVVVALVIGLIAQGVWSARDRQADANEIVKGVLELNMLTAEYIRHPTDRTHQQWNQRHNSLSELLQSMEHDKPEYQQLLINMRQRYEEMVSAITHLSALHAEARADDDPVARLQEQQFTAQLTTRSQALASLASRFAALNTAEVAAFQRWAVIALATLLGLMAAVVGGSALLIARDLTRAIAQLRHDLEVVGGGKLEHVVAEDRPDELGQLGRTFNDMSRRLRRITVSRDELQHEIDERRRTEDQLRHTRNFLDSIIENIPHMIFLKDGRDLRFVFLNKAGEALLGYKRSELIGKSDYDFFPENEARFFVAKDRDVLNEGELSDIPEESIRTRHHGTRILHTKKVPLPGRADEPGYLLGISEDITERKEAERKLQDTTAALQRSNRELEQFAYIASHDLQEPLRKVEGFGGMLSEHLGDALDDEGRDYLARMSSAVQRMRELIEGLLTYSRVTTKSAPFEAVDLNEVAREVVSDLEMRIRESEGQVEVDDLPTLEADRLQMRQLLQNLIGNGLKFHAPDRPPQVHVSAKHVPPEDDQDPAGRSHVRLLVRDNGIGIEPEYVDRLFIPFRRLHGRGSRYKGTGIGLAVCRKIAERHGGSIRIESTPGEGTTFITTLPCRAAEPHPEEEKLAHE